MRFLALAALLALSAPLATAQVAIPPVARVTDLTGTLTPDQRAGLEQRLAAFEQRKGSQVAVLIVPTTAPEEIEPYALRVAETWKLGRKGVDDGALLLVAKQDRAMRIEVGYGLEGALPDAIAKRIVAETITPHFRDGDFNGGISAGVDQMLRVIDGEKLPEPRLVTREQGFGASAQILFFIGIVLLNFVRPAGKALGEFRAAAGFGGLYGVICGLAAGLFAGAAGALVFTFFALLMLASRGMSGGGGHWGGHSSGGFGGGGRSSGGGFSGGGGGFGGGGASGRW